MITYIEAEKRMAMLIKEEMDFHRKHISVEGATPGVAITSSDREIDPEIRRQYEEIRSHAKKYGEELASYSYFYEIMVPWMVDITGATSEKEDITTVLKDLDFKKLIDECGSLSESIQKFIEANDFTITDRGCGCNSWLIGTPCTDSEMRRLCGLIHAAYQKAIDFGLVRVSVKFWGWHLPTLRNWDDVEKYYKG